VVIGQGYNNFSKVDPAVSGFQTLMGKDSSATQQILTTASSGLDLIVGQTVTYALPDLSKGLRGVYADSPAMDACRDSILDACDVDPSSLTSASAKQAVVKPVATSLVTLQAKAADVRKLFDLDPTDPKNITPDFLTTPVDQSWLPKPGSEGPNLTRDMLPDIYLLKPLDAQSNLAYRLKMDKVPPGHDPNSTGPAGFLNARTALVDKLTAGTDVTQHGLYGWSQPLNGSPYLSTLPFATAVSHLFEAYGLNPGTVTDQPPGEGPFYHTTYGTQDQQKRLGFWAFSTTNNSFIPAGMVLRDLSQRPYQDVLRGYGPSA
jgi:hypothetical protein